MMKVLGIAVYFYILISSCEMLQPLNISDVYAGKLIMYKSTNNMLIATGNNKYGKDILK